jgi:hypothetical protein
MTNFRVLIPAGLLLLAVSIAADAQQLYRWVDENGVVHYGDRVPPEYAKVRRDILNDQAVRVGTLEAEKTVEQLEAEAIEAQRIEDESRRDQVLLTTYLSIEEIEQLRDRRLELIDAQIRVTNLYLSNLRDRLKKLQREAEAFSPYNPDPDAPAIDEKLARELTTTLESILLYEKTLDKSRDEQDLLVAKFDSDIDRFKELKAIN